MPQRVDSLSILKNEKQKIMCSDKMPDNKKMLNKVKLKERNLLLVEDIFANNHLTKSKNKLLKYQDHLN